MAVNWDIKLYSEGAVVYEVDSEGDPIRVVAWARNHLAAVAAFEHICTRDRTGGYEVRNRSRVLASGSVRTMLGPN